jgi:hypothetical protein
VILPPQRIVLDRAVVAVEIVVIVVVVGKFIVLVGKVLALKVIRQRMAARLLVFLVGHSSYSLIEGTNPAGAPCGQVV